MLIYLFSALSIYLENTLQETYSECVTYPGHYPEKSKYIFIRATQIVTLDIVLLRANSLESVYSKLIKNPSPFLVTSYFYCYPVQVNHFLFVTWSPNRDPSKQFFRSI